jgi:hypothetical protein
MYDDICKLLIWLEKLVEKTKVQNQHLNASFQFILQQYRKIICEICFSNYKSKNNKKEAINQFILKFGNHF